MLYLKHDYLQILYLRKKINMDSCDDRVSVLFDKLADLMILTSEKILDKHNPGVKSQDSINSLNYIVKNLSELRLNLMNLEKELSLEENVSGVNILLCDKLKKDLLSMFNDCYNGFGELIERNTIQNEFDVFNIDDDKKE